MLPNFTEKYLGNKRWFHDEYMEVWFSDISDHLPVFFLFWMNVVFKDEFSLLFFIIEFIMKETSIKITLWPNNVWRNTVTYFSKYSCLFACTLVIFQYSFVSGYLAVWLIGNGNSHIHDRVRFCYNNVHNILKFFDCWAIFPFTQVKWSVIICNKLLYMSSLTS